jgi:hypothetical protein
MIRPRTTLLTAVLFLVIGVIYYLLSRDAVGTTLFVALAVGMGLLTYTLVLGTPRD